MKMTIGSATRSSSTRRRKRDQRTTAALVAEQFEHLLDTLPDDELRRIALLKLEGHSNAEIAANIDRSVPTVERRLRLIRDTWHEEGW